MIEEFDSEQVDTEQIGIEQIDVEQIDIEQIDEEQVDAEQIETHEMTAAITHVNAPEMYESVSSVYIGDKEAVKPPLPRVYAGSDIALQVTVSCSLGCDLRGAMVKILDQDAVLTQVELTSFNDDGALNQTDVFTLTAPTEPGEYTWTAVLEPKEEENTLPLLEPNEEEENTLPVLEPKEEFEPTEEFEPKEEENTLHMPVSATFTFIVEQHMISLSSWDLPYPVVIGSKFTLKAGARCVGDCKLASEQISLYDQQGTLLVTGILGEEPRENTVGVYWTELEVDAPSEIGVYRWELRFSRPDRPMAHEDASRIVVFRAARPPEHLLTIELMCDFEKIPVVKALVAVTSDNVSYRGYSDSAGKVTFNVPKGEYHLLATADDHAALDPDDPIIVESDLIVKRDMVYAYDSYK